MPSKSAPQDVRAFTLKAKALVWLDDSELAIPIALRGLELDRNFAPLLAVLARAYTDIGRYQQGLDYGEQAVNSDPMSIEAHRAYAVSLIWVGLRDQAIQELEDAVNINPNLTTPYFELAGQYISGERYEEAVAAYEKILSMQPRNAKALLRLCEVYSRIGQDQQAQGYCDDALAIDTNYKEAYRQLGMVNFRRRNYEGAIENFNRCVGRGVSEKSNATICADWPTIIWANVIRPGASSKYCFERIQLLPVKEPVLSTTQNGLRLVTKAVRPTAIARCPPR